MRKTTDTSFASVAQCDQMAVLFTEYLAHYQQWNVPQILTKVGLIFCQIPHKLAKIDREILKFGQSGEISPNLVALLRREELHKTTND